MFAIAQSADPYLTYTLSDASTDAAIDVLPERGGIVSQWRIGSHHLLYLDRDRFLNPSLSIRGGIPILFPICGNLPDDRYTVGDTTYVLPQHGFGRTLPWQVVEQSTEGAASLTLSLTSNDQTRPVYPFEFAIEFTYRLVGRSLEIHQRYVNHSTESLPFSTGLHPYFNVADKSKLRLDIPATEYQPKGDSNTYAFDGSFDYDQDEIDVAFTNVSARTASVTEGDRTLRLDYDGLYSTLVFWTVKGKDFYCLEPWSAPRNAINSGQHLTHLPAGESLETTVKMTLELG